MKKKRFKKICHQIAAIAMAILMVPNTQVFAQIAVDGVKKIDEKNWFKTNEKEFSSFDDSKALKVMMAGIWFSLHIDQKQIHLR